MSRLLQEFVLPLVRGWRAEPALFLYMLAAFLKMPVFHNLLFEKSCWELYHDDVLCTNVTAYNEDAAVSGSANRLFFLSSLCLILPSIPSSLLLGSMVDVSKVRRSLLIPYAALILSSFVYIVLSLWEHSSPYLLLIADVIFGACGGYTSIIGVSAAYSVRGTSGTLRSSRVARLEASIGLGGVIGNALAGTLRKSLGYTGVFGVMAALQLGAFLFVLLAVKDDEYEAIDSDSTEVSSAPSLWHRCVIEPAEVLGRARPLRGILIALFLAFGLELFAFSGMSDIQFAFMRYRLAWDDTGYGHFSALSGLFGTVGVLFLYPLLRLSISDVVLGAIGLGLKIVFIGVLSLTHSPIVIYSLTILYVGSRFVSTAFRTQIANLVEEDELGKISSLVSILEGVAGLIATAVLNNLFPLTLSVWDGICPLIIVILLTVALTVLVISRMRLRRSGTLTVDASPTDQ